MITMSVRLAEIRWSVCFSKPQRILSVTFSRMDIRVVRIPFVRMVKLNFLYNSQWITLPTLSSLFLYFCANWLYSFIMCFIVSLLSPHNQHLFILLRFIYFCFDIVGSYGVVFCSYQRRSCSSLKVSPSRPCASFFVWDFVYLLLEVPI